MSKILSKSKVIILNKFLSFLDNNTNIFYQNLLDSGARSLEKTIFKCRKQNENKSKLIIFPFKILVSEGTICCFIGFALTNVKCIFTITDVYIIFDCQPQYKDKDLVVSFGKTCLFYKLIIKRTGEAEYSKILLLSNNNCLKIINGNFNKNKQKNNGKIGSVILDIVKIMNKNFKVLSCELQDASQLNINRTPIPGTINDIYISLKLFSIYKYGKTWYERQGFKSVDNSRLQLAKNKLRKIKIGDIIAQMEYFSELGKKVHLLPGENKSTFFKNYLEEFDLCINDLRDFYNNLFNRRNITFVEAMNKILKLSTDSKTGKLFLDNNLKLYDLLEHSLTEFMPIIKQKIINKNNRKNKYFSDSISDILQEIEETTMIMEIKY
jgi:hypothetical protein